jgi:hypothetical protein
MGVTLADMIIEARRCAAALGIVATSALACASSVLVEADPGPDAASATSGASSATSSTSGASSSTSSTTAASSSSAAVGSSSGGAGGAAPCSAPADCPGTDSECQARSCEGGVCGSVFAPEGTVVMNQVAGDCQKNVCDEMGGLLSVADDTDTSNDANACTLDVCTEGAPTHPHAPAGTPCSDGGGSVCDGMGSCLECLSGADCASGACSAGICLFCSCADGIQNCQETDVDCGGPCGPCAGCSCATDADCAEGSVCDQCMCVPAP